MCKKIITVFVAGGIVQSVDNIPENITVVVRDYDNKGEGQDYSEDSYTK